MGRDGDSFLSVRLRRALLVLAWCGAIGWQLVAAVPSGRAAAPSPGTQSNASPAPPVRTAAATFATDASTVRPAPSTDPIVPPPVSTSFDHFVAARRDPASEGGVRRAPRPDLPDRFADERVFEALTRALQEVSPAAKITAVDCDEDPCLVLGTGFGTREEAEALRGTDALREYADDTTSVFGWAARATEGPETEFAIAVQPHVQPGDDTARLGARVQTMRDARNDGTRHGAER